MNFRNAAVTLLSLAVATLAKGIDLQLDQIQVGSVVYSNVVITKINPSDIYFEHKGGMANVKLRQLDPRLQRKFNFDPRQATTAEVDNLINNEEYKRKSVLSFNQRVSQERAEAIANSAPPFSLSEPLNSQSPLNKPAPAPGSAVKWVADKPPQGDEKFTLVFFWNSTNLPSQDFIPTLNYIATNRADKMIVTAISSDTAEELKKIELPAGFFNGSEPAGHYAAMLGINSIPAVALIDPSGTLRYAGHPAALSDDALDKLIKRYGSK